MRNKKLFFLAAWFMGLESSLSAHGNIIRDLTPGPILICAGFIFSKLIPLLILPTALVLAFSFGGKEMSRPLKTAIFIWFTIGLFILGRPVVAKISSPNFSLHPEQKISILNDAGHPMKIWINTPCNPYSPTYLLSDKQQVVDVCHEGINFFWMITINTMKGKSGPNGTVTWTDDDSWDFYPPLRDRFFTNNEFNLRLSTGGIVLQ